MNGFPPATRSVIRTFPLVLTGCLLAPLSSGCASTLDYAHDTASRRAGQGVGEVVGDKAVKEAKAVVDPSESRGGASSGSGSGSGSAGRTVTTTSTTGAAFAGGDSACSVDPHCLGPDDVLVCGDRHCWPSHAVTLPSAASKQQGQFIDKTNGKEYWSDGWTRSRPVKNGENLRVGQHVIYVRGDGPTSHKEALNASWYVAKITDLSDGFKGEFRSSRGHAVRLVSARVITESGRDELTK